ncbi:MAG: hypothetical protein ACI4RA_01810 [Kiritimatiellia bacterium]
MTLFFQNLTQVLVKTAPWWGLAIASFLLAYVLTPACRELARRCGMVDQPSARRINKTPIPRSGGLAIFLATALTLLGYILLTGREVSPSFSNAVVLRMMLLAGALVVVGLLDDRFGLPPLVKLAGQIGVALGVFCWCGMGFHTIPMLSAWMKVLPALDCLCTVFWIVGAINAFNLIDGLDGLATGLALISAVGMGGALFFIGYPQATLVYFVFAGACLAFLRYNFHPASVFLGDTGSMFIGFFLSTLALCMKSGDSLFVSLGVPILAMGVPIFDTALAILRRTLRAVIKREEKGVDPGNSHVMQADTDHLHHRFLRQFVSQRKAAGMLYGLALFFIAVAFGGLALRDRAAGFFIVAFVVAAVIVVRDMRRIELWDAASLLNAMAHDRATESRRRRRMLAIPFYMTVDGVMLVLVCLVTVLMLGQRVNMHLFHTGLPLCVVPVFFSLILFRTYSTVWSRAVVSNYVRLVTACFVGTAVGAAAVVLLGYPHSRLMAFCALDFALSVLALAGVRLVRPVLRDLFYALARGRLADSPATSRIVVYGAGLRYGMFHRELVRSAARDTRIVVGLLDDDVLLRGLRIGGQRIYGTLAQAKEILKMLRADAVVIACKLSPARLEVARRVFAEAGVKVSVWSCEEREIPAAAELPR